MRRSLTILLAAALVLGACAGGDEGPDPAEDPKGALVSAFQRLADSEGISMTATVQSDTGSLIALSSDGGGEPLTEDEANLILDSSVSVKGKGTTPEDSQSEIVVDIGGDLVELRQVNEMIYVRADVRPLVDRFEGNQAEVDQFVQQAPPQFSFVGPLVEGEWVALEGAEQLAQQFGAPSPDQKLQQKIATELTAAFEQNATVTSEGSDDVGEHLAATIGLRPLYDVLVQNLRGLTGGLPGATLPPNTEIPDEQIRIDAWVADGEVQQLEFDFLQIARIVGEEVPAGVQRLALRLELDGFDDDVEAPEPAASVNAGQLIQSFLGLGMTGAQTESTVTTPEDICAQLEGAPPEVIEQFAEECPELQS